MREIDHDHTPEGETVGGYDTQAVIALIDSTDGWKPALNGEGEITAVPEDHQ